MLNLNKIVFCLAPASSPMHCQVVGEQIIKKKLSILFENDLIHSLYLLCWVSVCLKIAGTQVTFWAEAALGLVISQL